VGRSISNSKHSWCNIAITLIDHEKGEQTAQAAVIAWLQQLCRTRRCANRFGKSNRMGKGRKKRGEHNKQTQRTREELDLVREKEMERVEREEAERRARLRAEEKRRAKLSPKHLPARGDPPPILGETDPLVRAPLKPKPHPRPGAIAIPEPEPEDAFLTVSPKLVSK